jgi:two-component system, chemotaxis family, chemotaxis protein CheY
MRVGLLEDDVAIQEMLLLVLQDEGYTVTIFPGAEECLDALGLTKPGTRSTPIDLDLLIADLRLNGLVTGKDVILQVRKDVHLQSLPIILTTASTLIDLEDIQDLHVALLQKPFSVDDIIILIKELIQPPSTID